MGNGSAAQVLKSWTTRACFVDANGLQGFIAFFN
jgi:hypothetical protein